MSFSISINGLAVQNLLTEQALQAALGNPLAFGLSQFALDAAPNFTGAEVLAILRPTEDMTIGKADLMARTDSALMTADQFFSLAREFERRFPQGVNGVKVGSGLWSFEQEMQEMQARNFEEGVGHPDSRVARDAMEGVRGLLRYPNLPPPAINRIVNLFYRMVRIVNVPSGDSMIPAEAVRGASETLLRPNLPTELRQRCVDTILDADRQRQPGRSYNLLLRNHTFIAALRALQATGLEREERLALEGVVSRPFLFSMTDETSGFDPEEVPDLADALIRVTPSSFGPSLLAKLTSREGASAYFPQMIRHALGRLTESDRAVEDQSTNRMMLLDVIGRHGRFREELPRYLEILRADHTAVTPDARAMVLSSLLNAMPTSDTYFDERAVEDILDTMACITLVEARGERSYTREVFVGIASYLSGQSVVIGNPELRQRIEALMAGYESGSVR